MITKVKVGHTAGPWKHEGDDHNPGRKVFALDWYTVAEVHDYDTSEGAANARLIAAAPEMLEALEHLTAAWATVVYEQRDRSLSIAIDKGKEAIRKARGVE